MKKRLSNKGQTTIIAEMLLLVIVVILATTFVASLHSNVSFYVQNKELTSMYVWTTNNDTAINIIATHSGGDPTTISGHIYFEYQNGTSQNVKAKLSFNNTAPIITSEFELSQIKFGEQFQLSINKAQFEDHGALHYILSSKSQILAEVDEQI